MRIAAGRVKKQDATCISQEQRRDFGRRLRQWFRTHGRDLPWRRTRDPYRVLVSELMLQQTQVSRVLPKYEEFLRTYPTLASVARSTPGRVCEAWRGLGYYARARNLYRLATTVAEDRPDATAGRGHSRGPRMALPSSPDQLRLLPGIGVYTAGAIASFAYERRAALVDTNVARVLRRVFVPDLPAGTPATARILWTIAETLLPRTGRAAWTHNQALIELGALVCTARVARCGECPVRSLCSTVAASAKCRKEAHPRALQRSRKARS